jgi:hypothetical protein
LDQIASTPSLSESEANRLRTAGGQTAFRHPDGRTGDLSMEGRILGFSGWQSFTNPTFRNQGECISYVNSH